MLEKWHRLTLTEQKCQSKLPSNQAHSSNANVYPIFHTLFLHYPSIENALPIPCSLSKSSSPKRLPLLRLLAPLRLSRFRSFLAIAPHHDDAQETAHDGAAQQQQDDGDADGPDAGREEGLDRVRVVDEGLCWVLEI